MAIKILDENDKNALQAEINGKVSGSGWSGNKFLGTSADGKVEEKDVEIPEIDVVDFVSLHDVMYGDIDVQGKSLVAIMPTENDIGSYNTITVMVSGYESTERWSITFTQDGLDFSEEQGYFPPFSVGCKAGDVVVLSKYLDIHETDTVTLDNVESNVAAKGLFDGIANASVIAKMIGGGVEKETDPTVPSWAKAPSKPTYTKTEVGLGNVDNVKQYSENNPPPYPVTKVNNKTGAVTLSASDVGADASGTANSAVSAHNTNSSAHNDIRLLVEGLTTRLNALADSDDTTLDQMSEIVAYIKSNKSLIEGITTNKVNVSDIINNLTSNVSNKPLSAAQGVALKSLIDAIVVPTKVSQLTNDKGYLTSAHNTDTSAHADIREQISQLSSNIPDYVKTEAEEVADKIIAKRTINSLVLLMGTDIHVSTNADVRTAIKHMGQGMNEICNYITPDGAVFLGDYNYQVGTVSKAQGIEDTKYFRWCVADVMKATPSVFMIGNHDYISVSKSDTENRLSEDEVYALIGSHNTDKVVVDVDNLGRNYGYVDFEKQRIRLIYLNTTDCAGVDYTSHLISTVQGQWFVSKALDFSDKEDEANWGVVVCSHIPLFDNPQVPTVLGNFVDRSSGSNFGKAYDFTNTKAKLIAVFHGHIHNFKVTTRATSGGNTITYICIPNAVPNRENPYTTNENYNEVDKNGNSVSYPKTAGTAEDTSFNAVVIDKDNSKIHAICYGAGYDREISYAGAKPEVVIVNQIPLATDKAGAIYGADYNGDGVNDGYKEGIRLGSDGTDRTNASTDATGFIPAKLNDIVYLSNCQIVGDGTTYNQIAFYKTDKTFVRAINTTATTIINNWGGVYDEANNLTRISLSALSTWTEAAEIGYIRISGNNIGANSVITVNQPIE